MINNKCPICLSTKSKLIKTVTKFPVYQGPVTKNELKKIKKKTSNLDWMQCYSCSSVYLKKIPPLKFIYFKGHATGYGNIWEKHYRDFSEFIIKNTKKSKFIDVGGGTGILANEILKKKQVNITILEPNPSKEIKKIKNIKIIKKDANYLTNNSPKYDSYIFSHSLEHMININTYLKNLSKKAIENSSLFISWPQQENWIKKSIPGTINFEHTYFINLKNLIILLNSIGFKLIKLKKFNNHSFFLYLLKDKTFSQKKYINYRKENHLNFRDYYKSYENMYKFINIKKFVSKEVYLMPASIYSQYIFYYLNRYIKFIGIIDNSESKQGKILFGTNLKIFNKNKILNKKITIILSGGFHTEEIKRDLIDINSDIEIIDSRKLLNAKN